MVHVAPRAAARARVSYKSAVVVDQMMTPDLMGVDRSARCAVSELPSRARPDAGGACKEACRSKDAPGRPERDRWRVAVLEDEQQHERDAVRRAQQGEDGDDERDPRPADSEDDGHLSEQAKAIGVSAGLRLQKGRKAARGGEGRTTPGRSLAPSREPTALGLDDGRNADRRRAKRTTGRANWTVRRPCWASTLSNIVPGVLWKEGRSWWPFEEGRAGRKGLPWVGRETTRTRSVRPDDRPTTTSPVAHLSQLDRPSPAAPSPARMPSDVFQSDAHAAPSSLPALALAPAGRRPLRSLLALLAAGVVLWTLYAGRSPPPNDSTGDPAADSGVSKDVVPNGPLTESAVWAAEALSRLRLKAGSLVQETGARWSASFGPSTGGASAGSLVAEAPRWAELGLEETDNGLVVLPELAAGEVLRRHPVELLIEVRPLVLARLPHRLTRSYAASRQAATKKAEKQAAERPLTLAQAVAQYRELFATEPPLGFDQWCVPARVSRALLTRRRLSSRPLGLTSRSVSAGSPPLTRRRPSCPRRTTSSCRSCRSRAACCANGRSGSTGLSRRSASSSSARRPRLPCRRFRDGALTSSFYSRGGKIVAVEGKEADSGRGRDILDLLTPVASVVPDLKVYFNVGAFSARSLAPYRSHARAEDLRGVATPDDVPRQIAHHRVLNATTHYGSKNQRACLLLASQPPPSPSG